MCRGRCDGGHSRSTMWWATCGGAPAARSRRWVLRAPAARSGRWALPGTAAGRQSKVTYGTLPVVPPNVYQQRNVPYGSLLGLPPNVDQQRKVPYGTLPSLLPNVSQISTSITILLTQTIQDKIVKYNKIQHSAMQYNTIQYNKTHYSTIQNNTAHEDNTIQYNTINTIR